MKITIELFNQICDFKNLHEAYLKARTGKMTGEKFAQSSASWTAYTELGNSWRLRNSLEEKAGVKFN